MSDRREPENVGSLRQRVEFAEESLRVSLNSSRQMFEHLTSVQGRCTELLLENRSLDKRSSVREFHRKFGHPSSETPTVPDEDQVRFRLRLMVEELFEVIESCLQRSTPGSGLEGDARVFEMARGCVDRLVESAPISVDLPSLCAELADLDYVVEGTRVVLGVDGTPIHSLVHRANMSKVSTGSAKPEKPDGSDGADVAGELRRQGWRP